MEKVAIGLQLISEILLSRILPVYFLVVLAVL